MRKHTKRMIGYLLAFILFLSDVPIVANADASVNTDISSAESVAETSETQETVSTPEEAHIIYELTEKRDETTKYFAMSDGTTKACIYPQNIHYLEDGEYEEIDNTLVKDTKGGKTYYKNKKNSFSVKIPENYADDYIEFADENGYVKFKLKGATNKKLEKIEKEQSKKNKDKTLVDNVNDKAIFKSVKADVDIEYDVAGNKLKETIILYKKTKNAFVFEVQTSADRAVLNNDNTISFLDEEGTEIYTIASPYMVDSAGEYSNDIEASLVGTGDSYTITYQPNYEWLSAKERVYPVKIDPTLFQAIYTETVADTYVTNAQTSSDTRGDWDILNVGKIHTTTGGEQIILRGLIKFEIPSEIGDNDCIVDAKLDLVHCNHDLDTTINGIQIDVHELNEPFYEGTTWWDNQPTYDPIITDYAIVNTENYFSGTTLSYDSFNLTRLVNKWHNGGTNHGIILKLHDDSSAVSSSQQVIYFAKQSTYYSTVSKFVEITYRNAVGLEDYWSYTTQDFGQYGTGYVNNYNGNLVYVHEDTSFNSLINGFTLSHVYNKNLTEEQYLVNDTAGFYGSGWRLNLVQKLEPEGVPGNSSVKYVYTDGDGTQHYFVETSDGKIVDEDGLGYTYEAILEGDLQRKITDKNGTVLKFDFMNYLCQIIDSNGNTINLTYASYQGADSYLKTITTSSGGTYTLNYDNNFNLTSITDNAQRTTSFRYSSGELREIQYPDGRILKFEYNTNNHWMTGIVSPDGTKIKYENVSPNGRISATKFYGKNGTLSTNTSFQYSQNQTRIIDTENRGITYQFDTYGRVTCVYDDNQAIYSQTYNNTVTSQNGIFSNNKLKSTSNTVTYVNNLLSNAVFNNGLLGWEQYKENSAAEISIVLNKKLLTINTIKITSGTNVTDVIMQTPATGSGRTYTFSGYIKTENVQSTQNGAALEVVVTGGNEQKHYFSEFITGTTDDNIDNGFQHVSVSFTLNRNETIARVTAGLYNASGTVYIDSLQLEEGDTANPINLITNSSLEYTSGTSPLNYIENYNDGLSCVTNSEKVDGNNSYKFTGVVGHNRYLVQQFCENGAAGDVYSFGGWGKGTPAPKKDNSSFNIIIHFTYSDGTSDWIEANFNEYISDWQFISKTVIAKEDYIRIDIYCTYYQNINCAYFDNLFLYRDTMQSYTYDDNGNVISTSDYAKQNQQLQYDTNNNLSKYITQEGSAYEQYSDSKNNVLVTRSGEGLQYDNEYDSTGNMISTSVSSNPYSSSITSNKTYYIRNKLSGKYIDISADNIQQNDFTGEASQKWKVIPNTDGSVLLQNQASLDNGYMTVYNCENGNGKNVHTYQAHNGNAFVLKAESLKIQPASNYTYKIMSAASNYTSCVEVGDNNTSAGANIQQWSYEGTDAQQWYFEAVEQPVETQIEDGATYMFRARHSGKYITLAGGSNDTGTSAKQNEFNYTSAQKYILNRYGDTDYYTFTTYIDKDKKLEISSNLNSIGRKYLRLGDNTITDNKLFKLEYNSANRGFYIIPKINETLALDVNLSDLSNNVLLIFTEKAANGNRFFIAEKISDTITASATYQDNGNYPHTITDARGYTTTYTYDTGRGLQTGVTDAKGTSTNYVYNQLNDRLEVVTSGNSTVNYQYETNGALKKVTSPSGSNYNFTYDEFGRVSQIKVGNQLLSETIYNNKSSSLVTYMEYGNGDYKNYIYDSQDRVMYEVGSGNANRAYTYDKQGNVTKTTDYFANTTLTTTYIHDLIGRISQIKASDGQTTNFVYDTHNRLSLLKWSKGDTALSSSYIYGDDSVENQKLGLIYGVKLNGTQKLGYEYDELARLQRRLLYTATPFITEYTYHEGASANTTTTLVKTVKNGNDTLEYTYDELGNIISVSKNGTIIEQYGYDALSQLISATYGGNTYTYSYDNGGNLTEIKKNGTVIKTYTYGNSEWKDQLTAFNGETITCDAIGNPLIYRNGISLTWQNGRQLASITQNGSALATYTYDADGLRNSKTVNGTTTEYYWQNGTLYGQKTGDESIFYLYDESGSAYGFILKNIAGQSYYYYEFNLQGDIIGIIDSTGTRVVAYTYGAWGDILSVTGTLADTIGQKNPLRYRGYYYDAETGFYYVSSRYYDPEIGRFINADKAIAGVGGDIKGYNLYSYCFNNPVNMSDPTGDWPKWIETLTKVVSVVAVVAAAAITVTAVSAVTAGTGSAAAVYGATIFLGAALSGINGAVANSKKGNSYTNGYVGGFIGGGIQAAASKSPAKVIVGGGVGVTVGTAITDTLNNKDPDSQNSTKEQIITNATLSGLKALVTSSITAYVGYAADLAQLDGAGGLMPSFTYGFAEGLKTFFGWADDAVIYVWE